MIAERFAQLDEDSAIELLQAADVAHAHVNNVQGMLDHPVLSGRNRWRTVETPGHPVRALVPPATLHGVEPRMEPVPAVGEHTDRILDALGVSADNATRLRAAGVV